MFNNCIFIILRDIVNRLKLQDTVLFNMILQYLIDICGREFSAENIINFLMVMSFSRENYG